MDSILKINRWLVCMLILGNLVYGQDQNAKKITDLKNKLQSTTADSSKMRILNEIVTSSKYTNAQEGLKYGNEALTLAEKKHWDKEIAIIHSNIGTCYATLFNYNQANIHFQKALLIYQKTSNQQGIAATYKDIALTYSSQKKYPEALSYFEKTLKEYQSLDNKSLIVYSLNDIANLYFIQNNNQKALEYYNQSSIMNQEIKDQNGYAYSLSRIGEIYLKEEKYTKAIAYFIKSIDKYDKNQTENIDNTLKQLSNVYLLMSKSDSKNKKKYVTLSTKTLERVSSKQQEYSQSVETLKADLKTTTTDTVRINILNRIASSYFYTNPKEGITFGEAALNLATKINWKKGIALANDHLGVCQWVLTDYTKALNYFYQSLTVYEDLKDLNGISGALNNLGLVNVEIKNYKQAFIYFDKAYEINKKTDNKILMVYNLNNIAVAYYEQKKYTKALEYYNKSKELNISMYDSNGLGYCYSKIGKIYSDQKNYTKSLYYLNEALKSYDKGQTYNIGNTFIEIGISYYKMALENPNNKKELLVQSVQYLNNAVNLFAETGILDRLSICYFELYKATKEQGNFAKSLIYFEKHNTLKDSLFSSESKNKLTNLQSKREIELRDKQIEIQNLKINSDSRKVYLLVTITVTIALLFVLFFWLYINKRSTNQLLLDKNKEISNINKQKDKFFSIIAHDLRGPFNGFLGLTELLAEDIDDMDKEEIQFAAVNMRSSANNLNSLLENLLEWSRMEQGLIPFDPKENILLPVVNECVATLEASANKKEITIQTEIPEEIKVFADNHILHAVIRNILSNAVKFTPKGGKIIIEGKEDDKSTTISIKDSGIGMDAKILENLFQLDVKTNRKGTDDEPSSGLGLILCKEFIEKHCGKIWVESEENKGSTFYFSFPKNNLTNTV
jgi:signal transduction histidine kinase/uncharacterized protein HemY